MYGYTLNLNIRTKILRFKFGITKIIILCFFQHNQMLSDMNLARTDPLFASLN